MRGFAYLFTVLLLAVHADVASDALARTGGIDLSSRKPGPSTGLPMPRFVSLKSNEVNVRRGPGWDHAIAWVFRRAGLPVEIIAEFDVWRQVRDSEGATGWVFGTLLSGRRTVLIAPWEEKKNLINMYARAGKAGNVSARLSPGVLGDVDSCDGDWCYVTVGGVTGYISQEMVWGVYPGETVE